MPIENFIILATAIHTCPYPSLAEDDGHEAGPGLVQFFRPVGSIVEFLHQGLDSRHGSPGCAIFQVSYDESKLEYNQQFCYYSLHQFHINTSNRDIEVTLIDGVAPCEPIHSVGSNDATSYRSNVLNCTDL